MVVEEFEEQSSLSVVRPPSPGDSNASPVAAAARRLRPLPRHSRICFSALTRRSSTLWLRMADTSMYLLPYVFANDLPSATTPHND